MLADLVHGNTVVTDESPLGISGASRSGATDPSVDSEGQRDRRGLETRTPQEWQGVRGITRQGQMMVPATWPGFENEPPVSWESVFMKTPPSYLCIKPLGLYPQLKHPLPASSVCVTLASGQRGIRGPPHPKGLISVPSFTPLAWPTLIQGFVSSRQEREEALP